MQKISSVILMLLGLNVVVAQPKQQVAIQLPSGFTSKIVANDLGRVRHIAVNSNGDLYMKLDKLVMVKEFIV